VKLQVIEPGLSIYDKRDTICLLKTGPEAARKRCSGKEINSAICETFRLSFMEA